MPERSFFDWRTALPGYTFILIILAINYSPLLNILDDQGVQSTFGVILAFLTLVGGSAIGFLVSQTWWYHFQRHGAQYFYHSGIQNEPRREIARLIEKYGLIPASNHRDEERVHNVLAVYGYVVHYQMEKQPEVVGYTLRRWDAFHVFSATRFALLLSFPIGLFFRIVLQFTVFESSLESIWNIIWNIISNIPKPLPAINLGGVVEFVLVVLLLLSLYGLFRLFGHARNWVSEQYSFVSISHV